MIDYIDDILREEKIFLYAPIKLSNCKIIKSYLLEKDNILNGVGTAFVLAVPYYTEICDRKRNISAYAVSRDYHNYFKYLFNKIIPKLQNKFPQYKFAGYSDHSPIAEVESAAKAGLGVIGDNHMLITKDYSSYVFLGEIITDMVIDVKANEIKHCERCGICVSKCPYNRGECSECLSAITQKKGELSEGEVNLIKKYGFAWGCDICQEECPHTISAIKSGTIYTPIDFFKKDAINAINTTVIEQMSKEQFSQRAYAWRGKKTLLRNLSILEDLEVTDNG